MDVINPATEERIATLTEDIAATLQEKWQQLKAAQPAWQARPLEERITVVKRFSELLETNKTQLAQILTSEVGKPVTQSANEVSGAIGRISWLAGNAAKYLADEIMGETPDLEERIAYEPLGVIANISAWNYPYLVGVNVFVPALLAGNAVLYKPSEYASLTGLQIERLWKEAGLDAHLFLTAIGTGNVGAALLEMPFDGYFFTGSYKTGHFIYNKVAAKMVPCQCELGGKDPLYVADDVTDIIAVAAATADGAFYNNGQSCCSVERIYVHENKYDAYIEAFVNEVRSWKTGAPTEEGIYFGPLTRKEQIGVLENQIADAVRKGAQIRTGGNRVDGKGYYFQPTVLTDVNAGMLVMKEESFGPVIGIMKVKNDAEAIAQMKDTEYGLTASVYSSGQARAESILQQVNAGTGYWNCCDRVSAALPWSGRKHSGFGTTLSHSGLRAFTKAKAYHLRKHS
ncbi:aldehyde dehydrogenase family protein [Niabella aurantiaca]|uniref:aldehyde dehydrogenase family protein n=1 Tax=Niabella aurantiaca TaxID=379900 RepID=UPI0003652FDF|nr:aldehyde dehydrogenase family protein [Niabella aurantiaca]